MDITQALIKAPDLVLRAAAWFRNRANPARQQALRQLQAFEAHDIQRTQINRYLPAPLQLPPYALAEPDELKKVYRQEHVDWVADFFDLESDWLDGVSEQANQVIHCYKAPEQLHQWLQDRIGPEEDSGWRFRLHLVTANASPLTSSESACFAMVLEELPATEEEQPRRYYHLGLGAHTDHAPCIDHLMQVMALANHHGLLVLRSVLPLRALYHLSQGNGLIGAWLQQAMPHPLQADHEFWTMHEHRFKTLKQLKRAGLEDVSRSIPELRRHLPQPPATGSPHE